MICKHCKKRIPDDSVICPKCKKAVIEISQNSQSGQGIDRNNIAILMTVFIVVIFFALSSLPFIIKSSDDSQNPSQTPEPTKSFDNSVVIPPESIEPENNENNAEAVNADTEMTEVTGTEADLTEMTEVTDETAENIIQNEVPVQEAEQITEPIAEVPPETIAEVTAVPEIVPTPEPIPEQTINPTKAPRKKSTPKPEPTEAPTEKPRPQRNVDTIKINKSEETGYSELESTEIKEFTHETNEDSEIIDESYTDIAG